MAKNKGESFRLKLVSVTNRFGFTITRVRAANFDSDGIPHPEDRINMKVLDAGQVSQRFQNIVMGYDVGGANQSNPDIKVLIYPAPQNTLTPNYRDVPIIKEGDEVYYNGWVHNVNRVDPLAIQDVNVYFSITTVRDRMIPSVGVQ